MPASSDCIGEALHRAYHHHHRPPPHTTTTAATTTPPPPPLADQLTVCGKQFTPQVLSSQLEYEAAGKQESILLTELKSKYVVLSATTATTTATTTTTTAAMAHGTPRVAQGKEDQLEEPRVVLWSREKVSLGWRKVFPPGAGMYNLGNTCYLNSSLQALFHIPALANWLLEELQGHTQRCEATTTTATATTTAFCSVCAMMKTLRATLDRATPAIKPALIQHKLKSIGKTLSYGRQEDAHEFIKLLLDHMEKSYLAFRHATKLDHRSKETTPLNQIFGGYLRQQVICPLCRYVSTTFSHFQDLVLDIRSVSSVDDALNLHFRKETLDSENAYRCEKCHKKVSATKRHLIERAPHVLLIQLKRFTMSGGKIGKHVNIQRTIDLTRFVSGAKGGGGGAGGGGYQYRLTSMVIHLGGSQHGGHYTAVAEASNGAMFEFDDASVRSISLQSALLRNPYILFYEMIRKPREIPAMKQVFRQSSEKMLIRQSSDSVLGKGLPTSHSANAVNGWSGGGGGGGAGKVHGSQHLVCHKERCECVLSAFWVCPRATVLMPSMGGVVEEVEEVQGRFMAHSTSFVIRRVCPECILGVFGCVFSAFWGVCGCVFGVFCSEKMLIRQSSDSVLGKGLPTSHSANAVNGWSGGGGGGGAGKVHGSQHLVCHKERERLSFQLKSKTGGVEGGASKPSKLIIHNSSTLLSTKSSPPNTHKMTTSTQKTPKTSTSSTKSVQNRPSTTTTTSTKPHSTPGTPKSTSSTSKSTIPPLVPYLDDSEDSEVDEGKRGRERKANGLKSGREKLSTNGEAKEVDGKVRLIPRALQVVPGRAKVDTGWQVTDSTLHSPSECSSGSGGGGWTVTVVEKVDKVEEKPKSSEKCEKNPHFEGDVDSSSLRSKTSVDSGRSDKSTKSMKRSIFSLFTCVSSAKSPDTSCFHLPPSPDSTTTSTPPPPRDAVNGLPHSTPSTNSTSSTTQAKRVRENEELSSPSKKTCKDEKLEVIDVFSDISESRVPQGTTQPPRTPPGTPPGAPMAKQTPEVEEVEGTKTETGKPSQKPSCSVATSSASTTSTTAAAATSAASTAGSTTATATSASSATNSTPSTTSKNAEMPKNLKTRETFTRVEQIGITKDSSTSTSTSSLSSDDSEVEEEGEGKTRWVEKWRKRISTAKLHPHPSVIRWDDSSQRGKKVELWGGSRSSSVVDELRRVGNTAYGAEVKSWSGGRSEVDQEVERERKEAKKRTADDLYNEEMDSGRQNKKIKGGKRGGGGGGGRTETASD
ncbi:LOW QUALITY PROTEIN: ubiquitin carboxyl-terminal hydrolase 36-like [Portunus trituberculatus]|uniref:LOW QUALITY PROTEIN: ubiquitin carboxyl-terminal hydrolase 36-like n=1 Tax=Portunus trituberculatus TaxID=210409 RepID=UPI001E1D068A|nr:LOW QUALITY PROTEIN: ubiquitin carboxyl-terminal hydrolase 36-like [Portunus trituberculatus]